MGNMGSSFEHALPENCVYIHTLEKNVQMEKEA